MLTCPKYPSTALVELIEKCAPFLLAVVFKCRCSKCSGEDRCSTSVGCFTVINHTSNGAKQTEKGCVTNSEEYRVRCISQENNKHRGECCKQDMCNDFKISDESNGKATISECLKQSYYFYVVYYIEPSSFTILLVSLTCKARI